MTLSDTLEETHYCEIHPERETELRCNKCERYMCTKCAVRTPIGYRCQQCVRNIEDRFYKGTTLDYLLVAVVCAFVGGVGVVALVATRFLFLWFVALFAGMLLGGFAAQMALQVTEKRRGRYSAQVATGATIVGTLVPGLVLGIVASFPFLIFVGVAAFTVYGRFQIKI